MMPFLAYPLALAGLAAVPALAAIYIMRNRFRRRQVSSLVLWRFQVQSKSGGAKVHRLQLPLLFFLELIALILLVAAAAGPSWKFPQSERPLVVVLDDSFSMRALDHGVSAQDRAREYLEKIFKHHPPPSTRVILAGKEPASPGSSVKSWRELDQLLAQWNCRAPASALNSAITLAAQLEQRPANILVLTDQKPADEKISNRRLEWHAFGRPVDNAAIVNASRTAFGNQDRCLLEIANFSHAGRAVHLTVQTGSNAAQGSLLALEAGQRQRLVFNIPSSAPVLRATLEPDGLAEDNEIQLLPPVRKHVRVRVALTNQALASLANRTLDATGLRAALSDHPDLVIQDIDAGAPTNAWNLFWRTAGATNAYTGPFVVDNSHVLAKGIALDGVVWAAAAITNKTGDVPVILAGNTPLLATRQDIFGGRHLTLNLNPELSTVEDTPAWPVLFWNILSWRISEMPGFEESNARLGAEVMVQTGGRPVSVTQPDGERKSFPATVGQIALDTPLPGIYFIAVGASTNQLSVNPLAADESDLSACATGVWGHWQDDAERHYEQTSTVWILGLAALGLLTAHLYLLASGKG